MEILTVITKEVFEKYVPAAKSPERNTSVFTRMADYLEQSYDWLAEEVIGSTMVETAEADEKTSSEIMRFVCLAAFCKAARSLDLVLTATGFGVVSTETTAPASAQRVNALIDDIKLQALLSKERIVEKMIKTEGWGATSQAEAQVKTLFYRPEIMRRKCTLQLTAQNWQTALQRALEADGILRGEISTEYMDELLTHLRSNAMTSADVVMFEKCTAFMGDFISTYDLTGARPNRSLIRYCVEQLESYPSSYETYTNSSLYKKRHAERFKNKQEDSSFFFM